MIFRNPLRFKALYFLYEQLRPYRLEILKTIGVIFITATTMLSAGYGLRQFVDKGLKSNNETLIQISIAVLILISFIIALSAYFRTSTTAMLAEKVSSQIKQKLFSHILNLDHKFFERAAVGDLLSRLDQDTGQIRTFISGSAAVALRSSIQLIGGTILLLSSSGQLTFFVFCLIPLIIVPIMVLGKKVQKLTRETQGYDGQTSALMEENISAISLLKSFGAEEFCKNRLGMIVDEKLRLAARRTHFRSVLIALVIGLIFSGISVVLWIGVGQVMKGSITAGQLSAFVFYAILVAGSVNSLAEVMGELATTLGASERLLEIFNLKAEITSPMIPSHLGTEATYGIKFKDVTFFYPSQSEQAALLNVSITINPGQKVALVGPSGSGKSTIFRLLMRYYDPQSGKILIDGIPTSSLALDELRSCFALVPQDPVMFNDTLFNNIYYGNWQATEAQVYEAARLAHVESFALQLSDQYETQIGEKGVRLSGGQKQRVALARAILKNAPVFLLDEATNALDSQSESVVQEALGQVLQDKSALIIAHRLATVKQADQIYVIDQGRVISHGTHNQLLKSCGLYKELAEKQFIQAQNEFEFISNGSPKKGNSV